MFGRHAAGLVVFLAVSTLPALTQQHSYSTSVFSIDGTVRDDADLHGLENVRVELKQSAGVPVTTTFTRGNGAFEFSGLASGEYVIEIDANEYDPVQQTVEIADSSRRSISVLLTRPLVSNPAALNAVISAHQLSAPRKAQDEFDKGLSLLYGKPDYGGAIAQFERAIKDFPTFYEVYAAEGNTYQHMGNMQAAEQAYRKSVELSAGQYSEALFLLSSLLSDTGRFQDASDTAKKSMQADINSWRGPFELARAQAGLKQFDEAEKNAALSRQRNPSNPHVYLLLANIHIGSRDFGSLEKDLDAYLKAAPNGPDADRVRKAREKLHADRKQADDSADADSYDPADVPDTADTNEPSSANQRARGHGAPAPDPSGLPPLPPPTPNNP